MQLVPLMELVGEEAGRAALHGRSGSHFALATSGRQNRRRSRVARLGV